jgi:hypothetical protein
MGTVTFSTAFSSASAPLQRGAVQEWRAGGSAWIAVATFLVAHAIVPHLAPAHAPLLSLIFLVLAPVLAAVACLRRGHGGGDQGWWMLALALTLWAGGMAANVLVLALGNSSGESNLSMLLFVLYGVPLIFIMASPQNEAWPVRLVDASLALVLGMLFFAYISTLTTMSGTNQSGQASLRTMFDLENLLIAGFALVRFNASRVALERNVLGALTLFALLYAACAGRHRLWRPGRSDHRHSVSFHDCSGHARSWPRSGRARRRAAKTCSGGQPPDAANLHAGIGFGASAAASRVGGDGICRGDDDLRFAQCADPPAQSGRARPA